MLSTIARRGAQVQSRFAAAQRLAVAASAVPVTRSSQQCRYCEPRPAHRAAPASFFHTTSAAWKKIVPYNLADIGEAIAEVELVSWDVEVGDTVEMFEQICVVESDKATVPITSKFDGKIVKLHYEEGDLAATGKPLVDMEVDDDVNADEVKSSDEPEQVPEPEAAAAAAAPANDGPAAAAAGDVTQPEREGKYPMTPAVRRILKENNLVASQIAPTGKNGRILKEDVIRFLDNGGTTASAPEAGSTGSVSASAAPVYATTPPGQQAAAPAAQAAAGTPVPVVGMDRLATDTIVKVQGLQRTMVKSMNAANAIPQFGYSDECVITNLVALRAQLKDAAAARGVKLSYMPFILKAASLALHRYPILNAHVDTDCTEITYKSSHNLSLAMQTPQGLLVPNVKDCQDKTIFEIAEDLNRLQALGTAGRLAPADLQGGTFAISNIGVIGGTYMTPILVVPQVAIGALGSLKKLPRYNENDEVVPEWIMEVSWSADHRVIDGVTMAQFSNLWKSYLENPASMTLDLR